jgi:hypothetical protein
MFAAWFSLASLGLIFFMMAVFYTMTIQRRAVDAQVRGMSGIEASVSMQREGFEMQRQSFDMQKQLLELSRENSAIHKQALETLQQILATLRESR